MRIGLIKETKIPVDNRVALTPTQARILNERFPQSEIVVQTSGTRVYSDDQYRKENVKVLDDMSSCDLLVGIKEAQITTLLPNKHYLFFGHLAKEQEYNRPLLQAMIDRKITFSDYEYLVDATGHRVCAFGWWAGVVGVYYTLRGYGLRNGIFTLPKPDLHFTLDRLCCELESAYIPAIKILVTGKGRVSEGAQYILGKIGAQRLTCEQFMQHQPIHRISFCVATLENLVSRCDGRPFNREDFRTNSQAYMSCFSDFAPFTDVLVSCHFYGGEPQPVYLTKQLLRQSTTRIQVVGDITCDIGGSIECTLRSSTHDEPFYDYNPQTEKEEPAFSSPDHITVMAVDTCPNALAMDASEYFGNMLIKHVFTPLIEGKTENKTLANATILKGGQLTEKFEYLKSFSQR